MQPASTQSTVPAAPWQTAPDVFPISYWCGPPPKFTTIERYREIKDANFTLAFPPCGSATPELNHKILDHCRELGMKAVVQDPRMHYAIGNDPKVKADLDAMVKEYADHPALAGYFCIDEPATGAFAGLGEVVAYLRERDPKHLTYINLLPNYATPEQLGAKTYEDYLRAFVEQVKPALISYDHYMFAAGDDKSFYAQIELTRRIAQESNLPFWNIVLAIQHFAYRNLTEGELRFEAMQTLAYGGKELMWFTYWSPAEFDKTVNWQHSIIEPGGARDPHYDMIARINGDVLAMGSVLLGCTSADVFAAPTPVEQERDELTIDGNKTPVTVGLFRDASAGKTIAVIASRDWKNELRGSCKIRTDEPRAIEQFDPAQRSWSQLNVSPGPAQRTNASFHLPPGGAVMLRW